MFGRLCGLVALSSLSLLAACEATADLGGNDPSGSGTGSASPEPEPTDGTKLPAGPPAVAPTPADVAIAEVQARCANPAHGPIDNYASFADLKTRLVGRWFACDRPATSTDLYQREAGIEFRADGTWNLLRLATDGTFVAQRGIDNEGTWHEKYTDFIGYFQVNLTSDLVLTQFAFESTPRRMRTIDDITKVTTWLVPLGVDDNAAHTR